MFSADLAVCFVLRHRKTHRKVPGVRGRDDGVDTKDGLAPETSGRPEHRHGHQRHGVQLWERHGGESARVCVKKVRMCVKELLSRGLFSNVAEFLLGTAVIKFVYHSIIK